MNNRLKGVELVSQLRACSKKYDYEVCNNCLFRESKECFEDILLYAADYIEENLLDETVSGIRIPKNGHWIIGQEQRTLGIMNTRKCSECGRTYLAGNCSYLPRYCEDCGAKMFEEESND